jgi:hypothetical protein
MTTKTKPDAKNSEKMIGLKFGGTAAKEIDKWIFSQGVLMSRPEAVRRLVALGLKAKATA